MGRNLIFTLSFLSILIIAGFFIVNKSSHNFIQSNTQIPNSPIIPTQTAQPFEIIASNLSLPWQIRFLPSNEILFTQREGSLNLLSNGVVKKIAHIEEVKEIGEGGLLGLALHPDFSKNHYLYLYYTYQENNNQTLNRVVRYKFENNFLVDKTILVDQIPGANFHNGGRLEFGPDNLLYITTGDSQNPSLSQDKNSLAGKILRVTDEGKATVYSYGHRNPQGLAWDNQGRLWETEHGNLAHDEINLIEKGANYGWPNFIGENGGAGITQSTLESSTSTWAPSGTVFYSNSLFFGGLKGEALFQAKIQGNNLELSEHFKNQFGRIRGVVVGPDQMLYIWTNNKDGRGTPNSGDDKIIKINPSKL